jgi:hypothetical protein
MELAKTWPWLMYTKASRSPPVVARIIASERVLGVGASGVMKVGVASPDDKGVSVFDLCQRVAAS